MGRRGSSAADEPSCLGGPAGSIVKLQLAETVRAVYEYCLDLEGPNALLIDDYTDHHPDVVTPLGGGHPGKAYLRRSPTRSRAARQRSSKVCSRAGPWVAPRAEE